MSSSPIYIRVNLEVNMLLLTMFHTEGGVPWDFPPLAQLSPLKLCRAYCILGIIFPPQWHHVLYLLILKTMVLYETLTSVGVLC